MGDWSASLAAVPTIERRAILVSVGVSVLVTGIKFVAYGLTGSAAVFSDALESIVNVAASVFALYSLVLAHRPADEGHPYGHGKIEFLSATFEGGMIFAAGVAVVWHAVTAYIAGPEVNRLGWGLGLVSLASGVNLFAGWILIRVGRRQNSLTLEADGKHLLSDVVTSAGVLASLMLVWLTGRVWIDVAVATVIGVYLCWTAWGLIRRSAAGLMDEQDEADDRLIRSILDAHVSGGVEPRVCGYEKLRHRHHGRMHWVDFHLRVPAMITVSKGHDIAGVIESEIERALGEADATAHIEPCDGGTCGWCAGRSIRPTPTSPS
jgi:cation diffusion facilitator family transporter